MGGRRRASRAFNWTDSKTRVLITGDADWRDAAIVAEILRRLVARYGAVRVAHPDDAGAAAIAARVAQRMAITVDCYRKDTSADGSDDQGSTVRRNRLLCRAFQADLVVAFTADLRAASAAIALDIIRTAFAGGAEVYLVYPAGQVRRWTSGQASSPRSH